MNVNKEGITKNWKVKVVNRRVYMTLISKTLDFQEKEMVVAVGSGKTTIINRLAEENLAAGKKVVVSTTTEMFAPAAMLHQPWFRRPARPSVFPAAAVHHLLCFNTVWMIGRMRLQK